MALSLRKLAWLLALAGTACEREPPPEERLAQASNTVTLGTFGLLGPHQLESTVSRERDGRVTVETLRIAWGDPDNFQVQRLRDGRPVAEVRVIEAQAWSRTGTGRFAQHDDAEVFRVELGSTWSLWGQALSPFGDRVLLADPQDAVFEGRPATRYAVSLAPTPAPLRRNQHEPVDLQGHVVLDQATALRLQAEVEGRYLENGKPDRMRTVRLNHLLSAIGEPPALEVPKRTR